MTLYEKLQQAQSEEDVKKAYLQALGLSKIATLGIVDIKTKEIWFEAKDGGKVSTYAMFTQLLYYVRQAMDKGDYVPPFLCVIDAVKAAIMKTEIVLPLLDKKTIKWGKSASHITKEALDVVSAFIGTHFVSFKMETHSEEFIETVKKAIKTGEIIRAQITPDNLKQVFDKWIAMIGNEIKDVSVDDYALLFFADIMNDGTVSTHENLPAQLIYKNNKPAFSLNQKVYELGNQDGYRRFWTIYHRPPKQEYRNYLLERRDSLIPTNERSLKGAYYTPLHVVEKAYELLGETLGKNWQREYIVWDMCCGVGNLETKHSNHRNLFMSTLDQADVDVMKAARICVAANRFQYDYLNDDVTENGEINYSLTGKIPAQLQKAIFDKKKILVLINPPYAEAGSKLGKDAKGNVAKTKWAEYGMSGYGKASNELFTQFVARIYKEIPNATLAMFSKLKYVNATNFTDFRNIWRADYLNGFIIHSKAFEGLNGDFPIGFLVWKQNQKANLIDVITAEMLDKNATPIGTKNFYNITTSNYLNVWIKRPKINKEKVIPLKNAIVPATAKIRLDSWSDNAIAHMWCKSNDMQNTNQTVLFSSPYSQGDGFFVNSENLWQAAVVFTVRRIIKPTWINDRDQFLQPSVELPQEFIDDCLVWMLFNGSNLTASANDLEWNNQKWSIVNHFIPYSESEVDAPERFESDFMYQYIADKTFSDEALAVLAEGKNIWTEYFKYTDTYKVREELKLNRADVGWHQVRNAIKIRNEDADSLYFDFVNFEEAYKVLTEKLRPCVFEFGFLKS